MKTQTLVLLLVGALLLVAGSAVVTGFILRSKEEPPAPVAKLTPPAAKPVPTPVASAPATISLPVATKPVVVVALPTPTPAPTAAPAVVVAPAAQPAPSVTVSVPAASAAQSAIHVDQVQALVERYRVSGVRTSSSGSKALIDGHIYKLNDVIEKSLGLTLVGIDTDHLTFRDREGQTYVKNI